MSVITGEHADIVPASVARASAQPAVQVEEEAEKPQEKAADERHGSGDKVMCSQPKGMRRRQRNFTEKRVFENFHIS